MVAKPSNMPPGTGAYDPADAGNVMLKDVIFQM